MKASRGEKFIPGEIDARTSFLFAARRHMAARL
jgi:hypothetical protein